MQAQSLSWVDFQQIAHDCLEDLRVGGVFLEEAQPLLEKIHIEFPLTNMVQVLVELEQGSAEESHADGEDLRLAVTLVVHGAQFEPLHILGSEVGGFLVKDGPAVAGGLSRPGVERGHFDCLLGVEEDVAGLQVAEGVTAVVQLALGQHDGQQQVPEFALGEAAALLPADGYLGGEQLRVVVVLDLRGGRGTVSSPVLEQTPPSSKWWSTGSSR